MNSGGSTPSPQELPPGWEQWARQGEAENRKRRARLGLAILGSFLAFLLALHWDRLRLLLEPRPVAVWVVAARSGDSVARTGRLNLGAGEMFDLYAVVEAATLLGERIYFTEAAEVELDGRRLEPRSLRPWVDGFRRARLRWHTLEGFAPYLRVESKADLERFRLVPSFRPELGSGWSTRGLRVDPRLAIVEESSASRPLGWGTERFALRFEVFDGPASVTPSLRLESSGFGGSPEGMDPPPGLEVLATLPEPLDLLSARAGLMQVDPASGLDPDLVRKVAQLDRRGLAAIAVLALGSHEARFRMVEVPAQAIRTGSGDPLCGPGLDLGDLVHFGELRAVYWQDREPVGRCGGEDLVWSWSRGGRLTSLRSLAERLGAPSGWRRLERVADGKLDATVGRASGSP